MAKVTTWILGFLILLFISFDCFSQNDVISRSRAAVIKTYHGQLGVKELTGNNDGKQVEMYLATVGLGKGFPWCAAFVKWCLLKAGVISANKINGMALSAENKDAILYKQGKHYAGLRPGDVFTIFYKKLNRIGHTGFYNGWANKQSGTIFTVEGNTNSGGSRDGDGVYLRIRQIGGIYSISKWVND